MQESIHYSHCYIPASMAAILDEKPQLVAPAVRAFYYRDPIDLQVIIANKVPRNSKRPARLHKYLYLKVLKYWDT